MPLAAKRRPRTAALGESSTASASRGSSRAETATSSATSPRLTQANIAHGSSASGGAQTIRLAMGIGSAESSIHERRRPRRWRVRSLRKPITGVENPSSMRAAPKAKPSAAAGSPSTSVPYLRK